MMSRDDHLRSTRRSHTYYPMDDAGAHREDAGRPSRRGVLHVPPLPGLGSRLPVSLRPDLSSCPGPRTRCRTSHAAHRIGPLGTVLLRPSTTGSGSSSAPPPSTSCSGVPARTRSTTSIRQIYSDDQPAAFGLELIRPGTLGALDGAPIQYVLPTISETRGSTGLSYVTLDPSTLVVFTLPPDLVAPVRTLIEFLMTANREQGKEFELTRQSMTETTPYNFSAHLREKGRLFAEVTQPIGWNVRDLFKDDQLEPFSVWRQIRFLEFKVMVRDSIIEQLNTAIAQVGKRMGSRRVSRSLACRRSATFSKPRTTFITGFVVWAPWQRQRFSRTAEVPAT